MASPALQFLLLTVTGWVTRHQIALTEYLLEENRVVFRNFAEEIFCIVRRLPARAAGSYGRAPSGFGTVGRYTPGPCSALRFSSSSSPWLAG
jgi:hypothetical protein